MKKLPLIKPYHRIFTEDCDCSTCPKYESCAKRKAKEKMEGYGFEDYGEDMEELYDEEDYEGRIDNWNAGQMKETCPEGSKPRNGRCARADNSGYLSGKCDKGYTYDRGKDQCVRMTKEAKLSYKQREALPDSDFVYPKERKYPIPDIKHGRNALARVAQHGTEAEKTKVRAAVHKKFPSIESGE